VSLFNSKILNKAVIAALILAVMFSVGVCAAVSMSSMREDHSQMPDVVGGHIDHAQSLLQAIVPFLVLIAFVFCAILSIVFISKVAIQSAIKYLFSYSIEDPPPLKEKLFKRLFNPRSPPRLSACFCSC
jgi:TRAP-type uncharacterized transport system fused permease subunit